MRLELQGLVARVPNSGTYPNRSALALGIRLDQSYEFTDMIQAAGLAATMEVLDARWCEVDSKRAHRLNVPPNSRAFETTKRWSADGQPVMVAIDVIPSSLGLDATIDPTQSVFDLVRELRGTSIEWETSSVVGRPAVGRELLLLDVRNDATILELTTLGISILGTPLYHASEIHRQGVVPYGLTRTVPRDS